MTRPRSFGYSVLELVLAMFLFLLVSGVLFKMFHFMTEWRGNSERQLDKQAGNLTVASKLASILGEMPESTLSATYPSGNPSPVDLALCGATSRDANGQWSETDMIPDDHFYQLLYLNLPLAELRSIHISPTTATPLTQPLDPSNFTAPISQAPDRLLGKNIEKFMLIDPLTGATTNRPTSPLLVRIVQQGAEGEETRTVERSIRFVR